MKIMIAVWIIIVGTTLILASDIKIVETICLFAVGLSSSALCAWATSTSKDEIVLEEKNETKIF